MHMKDYKNKILLSDLDGTLLDSNGQVSYKNKQAIKEFVKKGGHFGIATGRSHLNAKYFLDGIPINVPSIFYNGSVLYDYSKEEFIEFNAICKDHIADLLRFSLAELPDIMIQIYCVDMCYIVSMEELAEKNEVKYHRPNVFCNLAEILDKDWIKILLYGSCTDLKVIEEQILKSKCGQDIDYVYTSEKYLEILPNNINKGTMISRLKELMGSQYTIYAVGDYSNDREMIKVADVGIAPANALPEILNIADKISSSNDEGAIADVIYNIM